MNFNLNLSKIWRVALLAGQGVMLLGAFGVLFFGVNFLSDQNAFGIFASKTASAVAITHDTCVGGRCISVDGFGVSDCDINNANSCLNAPQSHLSCGRLVAGGGFACMYDPNGIESCNEGGPCQGDPGITGATCQWLGGANNQCVANPFGRDNCTPGAACGGFGGGGNLPPPVPGPGGNGGGTTGGGTTGGGTTSGTFTGASCTLSGQCVVNLTNGVDNCNPLATVGQANGCGGVVPPVPPNNGGNTGASCRLFSASSDGSAVYFCFADASGTDNCLSDKACQPGGSIGTYCSSSGICTQTNLAPGQASANCTVGQTCNNSSQPNTTCNIAGQCVSSPTGTDHCVAGATCTPPTSTPGRCSAPGLCSTDPSANGPSCTTNTDCPTTLPTICSVFGTCIVSAVSGTPCTSSSDCTASAKPECNANKKCVLGGGGTPCVLGNDSTCLQPLGCAGLACIPGGTGGPCSSTTDCAPKPGIPHCNGLVCSDTATQGNVCSSYKDCQPPLGCNQYQQCVYGGTLGTCNNNYDCAAPLGCNNYTKQCVPGGKDGSCYTNADCKAALGCNASTQQCVEGGSDGSCKSNADCKKPLGCDNYQRCVAGGPLGSCSNNADCQGKPRCNDITQKCVSDGTGTGSVCSKESDCQVTRCTQSEPYQCVPYGQGGTGRVCSLDSANPDKICQPPPKKGRLVINKFTRGADTGFEFYVNPSPMYQVISTSGSTTTSWGQGSTYLDVDPGTKENPIRYNIAEVLPDHWSFTGANCDRSFILTTNSVEEVSVESGETTTCNFYNVKNGSIKIINKNLSYPSPNTESAEYAVFPSPIYETITTQGQQTEGIEHEVKPATYTIFQNTPLDWNLVNVTCKQGDQGADVPTAIVNGGVTLTVRPGETTTCTFSNKLLEGNLIINKHAIGGSDKFYFDITRTGLNGGVARSESIDVKDGIPGALPIKITPGTYNINEVVPSGWALANFSCANTTYDVAENGLINVVIPNNQTVICDFYNTKTGFIKIVKEATDGDDTFNYKIENYSAGQGGTPVTTEAKITTTNGNGNSGLLAEKQGQYNITEDMPDGWKSNGDIVCDNGSFTQTLGDAYGVLGVTVMNGKTTTCTFKNIKKGKPILKIKKETTGGDATFNFKIENDSAGQTVEPLTTSASVTTVNGKGNSKDLSENPGGYNITEDLTGLTDWTFTSAQCSKEDGSTTGTLDASRNRVTSVSLIDGQTTTCVFRNYKPGNSGPGNLKIVKETEGQGSSTEVFYFNIDVATFGLSSDKAKTQTASVITYQSKDKPNSNKGKGETGLLNEDPGTYNIAEDFSKLPPGWKLESAYCDHGSFTMTDNGVMNVQIVDGVVTTCTFKNTKTGSLVIKKNTGLNGDAEFKFTVSPGINDVVRIKTKSGTGTNNGNCADGSSAGSDGNCSDKSLPNSPILKLPKNTYTITESIPTAWSLESISCVKEDKTPTGIFNSANGGVSNVIIESGQTTTCTVTNSRNKGGSGGGGGGLRPDNEILPPKPGYDPVY